MSKNNKKQLDRNQLFYDLTVLNTALIIISIPFIVLLPFNLKFVIISIFIFNILFITINYNIYFIIVILLLIYMFHYIEINYQIIKQILAVLKVFIKYITKSPKVLINSIGFFIIFVFFTNTTEKIMSI